MIENDQDSEGGIEDAPVFVDNRGGNTLARALSSHLRALRDRGSSPTELAIASAYFNPQGLQLIANEARRIKKVRILLGVEPTPESVRARRGPFDPTEPEFTRKKVREDLGKQERGLRHDRDLLPFHAEDDLAVRNLLDFLKAGQVEVRRYERHFLHAKAFMFRGEERGVISGSSNLTRAGLSTNLELNLGH